MDIIQHTKERLEANLRARCFQRGNLGIKYLFYIEPLGKPSVLEAFILKEYDERYKVLIVDNLGACRKDSKTEKSISKKTLNRKLFGKKSEGIKKKITKLLREGRKTGDFGNIKEFFNH